MVKSARPWLALVLLTALSAAVAAASDGVLEQMQREIAAIVRQSKSAAVSIEDERALVSTGIESAEAQREIAKALKESRTAIAEALREQTGNKEKLRALEKTLREQSKTDSAQSRAELERAMAELKRNMPEVERSIQEGLQNGLSYVGIGAPKSGTGFSIGEGYVLTTADVLEGMRSPLVVTDSGTRIKAQIVGIDSDLNVGLLKLPANAEVPALKLGDSSSVEVGHFAISIGNQSGQKNSVALALVAGVRTEGTSTGRRFYPSLIQIAGTVGAGTSGAPLLNVRGEVIGMMAAVPAGDWQEIRVPQPPRVAPRPRRGESGPNVPRLRVKARTPPPSEEESTAVAGEPEEEDAQNEKARVFLRSDGREQSVDIPFLRPPVTSAGFAIPINEIKPVVERLRSGHPNARGWMGVSVKDEDQVVEQDNIVRVKRTVKIEGIYPDSPAFHGGLEPGDILVSLNGKPVTTSAEVRAISVRLRPGETLPVVVKRAGEVKTIELKIGARPKETKPPITTPIKRSGSLESGGGRRPHADSTATEPAQAGFVTQDR